MMIRKPQENLEIQKPQQILPITSLPPEKKISQAKKAIQEAAKYDISKTTDDYEANKVPRIDSRLTEEDKKAVMDLNNWGGAGDDDDDDEFWTGDCVAIVQERGCDVWDRALEVIFSVEWYLTYPE